MLVEKSAGFFVCKNGLFLGVGKQKEDNAMKKDKLPVGEKYTLSINEAAQYFSIGIKKMLSGEEPLPFIAFYGKRKLISCRRGESAACRSGRWKNRSASP